MTGDKSTLMQYSDSCQAKCRPNTATRSPGDNDDIFQINGAIDLGGSSCPGSPESPEDVGVITEHSALPSGSGNPLTSTPKDLPAFDAMPSGVSDWNAPSDAFHGLGGVADGRNSYLDSNSKVGCQTVPLRPGGCLGQAMSELADSAQSSSSYNNLVCTRY